MENGKNDVNSVLAYRQVRAWLPPLNQNCGSVVLVGGDKKFDYYMVAEHCSYQFI